MTTARVPATAAAAAALAVAVLVTGCASGTTASPTRSTSARAGAGSSMAPGMSMTSGMSVTPAESSGPGGSIAPVAPAGPATARPTTATRTPAVTSAGPSKTALMACGSDIRGKIRSVLALAAPAPVTSTFGHGLFTCTYALPRGPLVLSVQQSTTKTTATAYFDALRRRLGTTENLIGLGDGAYATSSGTVVVIKNDQTLRVDATGLPAVFGSQHQKRTDLANEVASDVLGCWTGDE